MLTKFFEDKITCAVQKIYGLNENIIVSQPLSDLGDYTTNICFKLVKQVGKKASEIADEIIQNLQCDLEYNTYVQSTCEKNGHINIVLSNDGIVHAMNSLISENVHGMNEAMADENICLEYVSANPTGPISVVNGRAGVLGDVLSRIYKKCKAEVKRHYYVNDNPFSGQITALRDTFAYYENVHNGNAIDFPEHGYKGEYVKKAWMSYHEKIEQLMCESDAFDETIHEIAWSQICDLQYLDIVYDYVDKESGLISAITIDMAFKFFDKDLSDFTYLKDGATWLKTSEYGDDKDRVIIREDGRATYFNNDIIYHACKAKCYSRLINILGADHHGYIARINAVMRMWEKPDVQVILTQMVGLETIDVDGKPIAYTGSKREGQYLLLKEDFVDKVGVDAARWYFLNGDPNTHLVINVDKASEQNMSNPVFYVQYAHARLCSLIKKSHNEGVMTGGDANFASLSSKDSVNLIKKLDDYQRIVITAGLKSNVQSLKTYLYELAQLVQKFYESERLIGKPINDWVAALYLVEHSVKVLKNGLWLLGISAPEEMKSLEIN